MREQLAETIAGFVVIGLAAAFLIYSVGAAGRTSGGGYVLTARFATVDGLALGTDVRLSGVRVGAVTAIDLNPETFEARVRFTVDEDVSLPADSSVSFRNEGLLGGVYLAIQPGADDDALQPGEEVQYAQGPVDIVRLLLELVRDADDS